MTTTRRRALAIVAIGAAAFAIVTALRSAPRPCYRLAVQLVTPSMIREAGIELGR